MYEPILNLIKFLKSSKSGDIKQNLPLETGLILNEEAKLELQKLDSPWTEQKLKIFVRNVLKDRKIFMVSNREPYVHTKKEEISLNIFRQVDQ